MGFRRIVLFVFSALFGAVFHAQAASFLKSIVPVAPPTAEQGGSNEKTYGRIVRTALTADEMAAETGFHLMLKLQDRAELEARINRGEVLSRSALEAYLPTTADYFRVRTWLVAHGFKIILDAGSRQAIFARGSNEEIAAAFGVKMARVATADGEFTSAITAPSLPDEIAISVAGIGGLQPHLIRHPHSHRGAQLDAPDRNAVSPAAKAALFQGAANLTATGYNLITPAAVAAVYQTPANLTGAGQTIAIVGDSIPGNTDLSRFWSLCGISQSLGNFTAINVQGGPGIDTTNQFEVSLDSEWSSGLATSAKVRLYAVPYPMDSNSEAAAYAQILDDLQANPTIHQVTESYGGIESGFSQGGGDSSLLLLIAQGVTCFASSGDSGSNPDPVTGAYKAAAALSTEYPASDPSMTGVGGTTLVFPQSSSGQYAPPEVAWSLTTFDREQYATGGGISGVFSQPSWQVATGMPTGNKRCVPDVSAMAYYGGANSDMGPLIYQGGNAYTGFGTSLSSPIWAGLCALINQSRAAAGLAPLGFLNPKVYPLAGNSSFTDITSGSNGAYSAGAGYDLCTGLGTPVVSDLIAYLSTVTQPPWIYTQTASVTIQSGQSAQFSIAAGGYPAPTYQWQVSTDGGHTWTNLTDTALYSGATTGTLNITGASVAMNNCQYRCLASNSVQGNMASNAATLTVTPSSSTPFPLGTAGPEVQVGMSTAFDGTNYLVGFQQNPSNQDAVGAELFSGTGTAMVPYLSTGLLGGIGTVAFDGTNYLMIWGNDGSGDTPISGCFIDTSGAFVGTAFQISDHGGNGNYGLVYGGGKYLVWWSPQGGTTVNGRFVPASPAQSGTLSTASFVVNPSGSTAVPVGMGAGFDGTNFLVAWETQLGSGGFEIDGSFLSPSGAIGSTFAISQTPFASPTGLLSVAYDGSSDYLVLWDSVTGTGSSIYARAVAKDGTFPGDEFAVAYGSYPAAASDGANFLITWADYPNYPSVSGSSVYAQFFNALGQPQGSAIAPFSGIAGNGLFAQPLFDGTQFLIVGFIGTSDVVGNEFSSGATYGAFVAPSVSTGPIFTTQPVSQSVTASTKVYFVAIASGNPSPTYQWQVSNNGGATWTNLTNAAPYGGISSNTLTIAGVTTAMSSYQYQCLASNSVNGNVPSNAAILTVSKAAQTINFPAPGNKVYGSAPFSVWAASSSGLPVILSVVSGPATVSGATVTLTGTGLVTLAADQAGDANFNAATEVTHSFTVVKATATVTLGGLSATYNGKPQSATATTTPTGLTVTFTYAGSVTAPTNAGSYAVVGTVSDTNYQGSAKGTLVIAKAAQTINFPAPGNKVYGSAPFNVWAGASSGLPVYFSVVSGPATISGTTVTLTGTGLVTLAADQTGNVNYNAASEVTHSFTVVKATAIVNLAGLSATYNGKPQNATATTTPTGLTVTFTYNGNATTPTNAGSYAVVSTINDTNYRGSAKGTLVIAKAPQTINFAAPGNKSHTAPPFNLSGSASSGLPLTFSVVGGPATISGRTVTLTGAGLVTLEATQAGNANFNAAASVDHSFTVN